MDYYEELGIAPNATEEDIRRAYRRMTKLLHPDQHTDEGVKQLAEVQMRRLNSIVAVLLDPAARQEYDYQLRLEAPQYQAVRPVVHKSQRRRPNWPWWIASTAAAIALTLVVVWFWANDLGSSFRDHNPTYIPAESRDTPSSAAESTTPVRPEPETRAPDTSAPATPPQSSFIRDTPTVVQAPPPSRTLARVPKPQDTATLQPTKMTLEGQQNQPVHKSLVLPNTAVAAQAPPVTTHVDLPPPAIAVPNTSHLEGPSLPVASMPAAPLKPPPEAQPSTKPVSYASPAKSAPVDPLVGEWVYAPSEPEKKKAGFYPPEFIDLKLFSNDGRLHGQYHARYRVTDRPIPPDVEFSLSPDNESNKFIWKAANGTRGTFKISSIDPNVIRIEWRTTVFGRTPALTAGTATLVKRTQ
jgi:cytoskeletal protein RodZ